MQLRTRFLSIKIYKGSLIVSLQASLEQHFFLLFAKYWQSKVEQNDAMLVSFRIHARLELRVHTDLWKLSLFKVC